ncbi:MAG: hypothetical protein Kow00127_11510 [Bacteroidales bacterium]
MKKIVTLACLVCVLITSSFATDIYWTGASGKSWFNAANWNPAQVPESGDNVFIFFNSTADRVEIGNGDAECHNLTIGGTGGEFELNEKGTLTCSGYFFLDQGCSFEAEGTLTVGENARISGLLKNQKKGDLVVADTLFVLASGELQNTGNGNDAPEIYCNTFLNYHIFRGEDMALLTVESHLLNYFFIELNNFGTIDLYTRMDNYGSLVMSKKSEIIARDQFFNHDTITLQDKAAIRGAQTGNLINYGEIHLTEKTYIYNFLNIENWFLIDIADQAEVTAIEDFYNHGWLNNYGLLATGLDFENVGGGILKNYGQFTAGGSALLGAVTFNYGDAEVIADLTVPSGGTVTNSGCFVVMDELNIEGEWIGPVLNYGPVSGDGTLSVMRVMESNGAPESPEGWHLFSSPASAMTTHSMYDYWIKSWDESQNMWVEFGAGSAPCVPGPELSFAPGTGYSLKRDVEYQCGDEYPATGDTVMIGGPAWSINSGDITVGVTGSDFEPGNPDNLNNWNLIGNPYPATIDISQMAFPPEVDDAVYFYNDETLGYEVYVGGVGRSKVAPGQGFFVHVNTPGSYNITFSDDLKDCDNDATWYKDQIQRLIHVTVVNSSGETDQAWLRELENSSGAFDRAWDAYKLMPASASRPVIYTESMGVRYAVQTTNALTTVPLTVQAGKPGQTELKFECTADWDVLLLEDRQTGSAIDLNVCNQYSFETDGRPVKNRFFLRTFQTQDTQAGSCIAIATGRGLSLYNASESEVEYYVYDITGRTIFRGKASPGLNPVSRQMPSGLVILATSSPKGRNVQKLLLP